MIKSIKCLSEKKLNIEKQQGSSYRSDNSYNFVQHSTIRKINKKTACLSWSLCSCVTDAGVISLIGKINRKERYKDQLPDLNLNITC